MKATVVLAFIAGICMAPQLWFGYGRSFPVLSYFESFNPLSNAVNSELVVLFAVGSLLWVFYNKWIIGVLSLLCIIIVVLQDQMRWQPWVYLYLLLLLAAIMGARKDGAKADVLFIWQLTIAGVYVWSGLHKFNAGFIEIVFAQMAQTFHWDNGFEQWKNIGYIIPVVEVATGVGLLWLRTRKIAVLFAIATHTVIIAFLTMKEGPANTIVYPWNIAMILLVVQLFWLDKERLYFNWRCLKRSAIGIVILSLVWLFPILNLLGYWDHYLSCSLYSGKPPEFYIAIEESASDKIPDELRNCFAAIPGLEGGKVISVQRWAIQELNVPVYPEARVFNQLSTSFCQLGIANDKMVFVILFSENGVQQFKTFNCIM